MVYKRNHVVPRAPDARVVTGKSRSQFLKHHLTYEYMGWRHRITPKNEALKLIKDGQHLEINYGSKPGYHIMQDRKVICRISKSTFYLIKG